MNRIFRAKMKICKGCGKPIADSDKKIYYVGHWYHWSCFKKMYGRKFGF